MLLDFWYQIFGQPTDWIMFLGVVTGGLAVLFLALNKAVAGWTFGVINAVFFIILMTQYKLYADTLLNVYYFFTSAAGLYFWTRGRKTNSGEKKPALITHLNLKGYVLAAIPVLLFTVGFGYFLETQTDSTYVYVDSFTTGLSLMGQYLLARKIFDNWYLWILADVIDIWLYVEKELVGVALLTGVYLGLCIMAVVKWRKVEANEKVADEPMATPVLGAA